MNKKFKVYILIFVSSFILNFIWENLHSVLYVSNTIGISNHFLLMLYASFIDACSIVIIFLVLVLINKNTYWKLGKINLGIFCILLFVVSFIIEKRAIMTNRWVYSNSMPIFLGIGISPLIQLVITGLLSLFILEFLTINKMKGGTKK